MAVATLHEISPLRLARLKREVLDILANSPMTPERRMAFGKRIENIHDITLIPDIEACRVHLLRIMDEGVRAKYEIRLTYLRDIEALRMKKIYISESEENTCDASRAMSALADIFL